MCWPCIEFAISFEWSWPVILVNWKLLSSYLKVTLPTGAVPPAGSVIFKAASANFGESSKEVSLIPPFSKLPAIVSAGVVVTVSAVVGAWLTVSVLVCLLLSQAWKASIKVPARNNAYCFFIVFLIKGIPLLLAKFINFLLPCAVRELRF